MTKKELRKFLSIEELLTVCSITRPTYYNWGDDVPAKYHKFIRSELLKRAEEMNQFAERGLVDV